jgi:hypothetical protein
MPRNVIHKGLGSQQPCARSRTSEDDLQSGLAIYHLKNDSRESQALLSRTVQISERAFGTQNAKTFWGKYVLAGVLREAGK